MAEAASAARQRLQLLRQHLVTPPASAAAAALPRRRGASATLQGICRSSAAVLICRCASAAPPDHRPSRVRACSSCAFNASTARLRCGACDVLARRGRVPCRCCSLASSLRLPGASRIKAALRRCANPSSAGQGRASQWQHLAVPSLVKATAARVPSQRGAICPAAQSNASTNERHRVRQEVERVNARRGAGRHAGSTRLRCKRRIALALLQRRASGGSPE
jgi:hypothetical protein